MKNWVKVLIGVGGLLLIYLICFFYAVGVYNNANALQKQMTKEFKNVQATYQRRADLIPSLMETVKGAAANEQAILTKVTEARAGIASAQQDIQNAKTPAQLDAAGQKINTAFQLTVEAYPQIRSTENFIAFQAQLEGTENRINLAREKYNEAVADYNTIVSGYFQRKALDWKGKKNQFEEKEGFEAQKGAENAPKVKF